MSLQEIIESFRTGLMLTGLWVLAAIAVGVVGAWLYRGVAPAMRRPLTVAKYLISVTRGTNDVFTISR